MSVPKSRILDLLKVQCRIFSTTFNPERPVTMRHLMKAYPDLETWDEEQEDRLESIALKKQRGKGAPKKKRTKEESKKFAGRKKKVAGMI